MRQVRPILRSIVIGSVVVLAACAAAPEPAPEPPPAPVAPEPPGPQPEEPALQPESEVAPDPDAPIEVSEELFDQTFDEVGQTIQELNEIIARRDFGAWQRYLTQEYRRTYSDPDVLRRSSESDVLARNNIQLRSLEDYFTYVVVPSRANARLDDLMFRDEQTVEAIMEIAGQRYLLYLLKKEGDRWKIDTF